MSNEQVYRLFCKMFPLRKEPYIPTDENLHRWKWHIEQADKMPKLEGIERDERALFLLRLNRAVHCFSDFPIETRGVYASISGRFPGSQIWACGSRVRGDYVRWKEDTEAIKARAMAGMKRKFESDFDFWAAPDAKQVGRLPDNVDRCRVRVPEKEKIQIPMWDFDKLPIEDHAQVAQWIEKGDWGKLVVIHNKYALSPHSYCCDIEGLKNWFRWGLENGKIKYDSSNTYTTSDERNV